jgi:S1-C subfamily serine protease
MSLHQYLCPKCGLALQSPRDVAGRQVRCLGCQAVFVAAPPKSPAAPLPKPNAVQPPEWPSRASARAPAREDDYPPPGVSLPPVPRSRKLPTAAVVIGGALFVAIAVTVVVIQAFKPRTAEPTMPVAQAAVVESPPPNPHPEVEQPLDVSPRTFSSRPEEEEEDVPGPTPKRPAAKAGATRLPDPNGSPLAPEPKPADPKPPATKPADPVASRPAANPPETKPADVPPADGQIPSALLARLKAATVFVKVQFAAGAGSGSGFVLRLDGDHALIVTNDHVARPRIKDAPPADRATYDIVFHSGRRNEFSRTAELIAGDFDHDLAVLRVSGVRGVADFPEPLNATDPAALAETTPIYVIGFPFGEKLAMTKGNPAVTITRGVISSVREDVTGDTAFVQIDADSNPGNSGGPVVDGRGRLVGVLRGGKPGTRINFAIPQAEVTRMLNGRVSNLDFRVGRTTATSIDVEVHGALIDPLDRVTAASLRLARTDMLKEKPAVGPGGKWAPLPGTEKTDLRISGRTVSATVTLPLRNGDRGKFEFLFQPACEDKDGRTTYFAPVSQELVIRDRPAGGFRPGGPGVGPPGFPGVDGTPPAGGGPPPGFPSPAPRPPAPNVGYPSAPKSPMPGFPGGPGGLRPTTPPTSPAPGAGAPGPGLQ